MDDHRILSQIKSLNKIVARNICSNDTIERKNKYIPTPTQMEIMDYILQNDGKDIYQKDLEDVLKLRRATVSGVLQTMEKNNLIFREKNSNDSRVKKIILSGDTKKIFMKNRKKLIELEKVITSDISDKDLRIFMNVLEKMKENLSDNLSSCKNKKGL